VIWGYWVDRHRRVRGPSAPARRSASRLTTV
jgi:hypothetical protein